MYYVYMCIYRIMCRCISIRSVYKVSIIFFVICEYLSHFSPVYFNQNFILVLSSMCYFPRIQYKLHCIVVIDLGSILVKKVRHIHKHVEKKCMKRFSISYTATNTNTRHNVTQCCRGVSHIKVS